MKPGMDEDRLVRRGPGTIHTKKTVAEAEAYVDFTGLVQELLPVVVHKRGPKRIIPLRIVLVCFALQALHDEPMLISRLVETMLWRLPGETRRKYRIPVIRLDDPAADIKFRRIYDQIIDLVAKIIEWQDPEADLVRNTNLPLDEWVTACAKKAKKKALTPHDREIREQRNQNVFTRCVLAGIQMTGLNPNDYGHDAAIDATALRSYSAGNAEKSSKVDAEPEGGRHHPKGTHAPEPGNGAPGEWGYDLHLLVGTAPKGKPTPCFVYGGRLAVPGSEIGENAWTLVLTALEHGIDIRHLIGDRAYNNTLPEKLQDHLRAWVTKHDDGTVAARGINLVADYRDDQLGVHGSIAGAVFLEGAFFCETIEQHPDLVNATKLYRDGRLTRDQYRAAIEARRALLVTVKEQGGTFVRIGCAVRQGLACIRKPGSDRSDPAQRWAATEETPLEEWGAICTSTATVHLTTKSMKKGQRNDFAKLLQDDLYGSDEWGLHYGGRNRVEHTNEVLKDAALLNMEDGERRRLRGRAGQTFILGFVLGALNVKRGARFMAEVAKLPNRRKKRTESRKGTDRRVTVIHLTPADPDSEHTFVAPEPEQADGLARTVRRLIDRFRKNNKSPTGPPG